MYDVNTGNIAAFVNDDISGVLTYTYETTVSTFDATNGVKLDDTALTDIDGVTTMEAGSVLAWTDTAEPLGAKIGARIDDSVTGRWTPSTAGTYIFRRATKDGGGYTYAGYYYNGTNFYKIAIGGDINPNAAGVFDVSTGSLGGDAVTNADGIVTSGSPAVKYIIETKVNATDMTYTFDSVNNQLVFQYTAAVAGAGDGTYDASALAARKEVDYANAKKYSELAEKLYNNANADLTYARALANESNALIDAADAANTAVTATEGKKTVKDGKWDGIFTDSTGSLAVFKESFSTTFGASFTTIGPDNIVPASVVTAAGLQTTVPDYDYPYVHQNYTELTSLYSTMSGYKTNIESAIAALEALRSNTSKDKDPATIQAQVNIILNNIYKNTENYQKALGEYKTKYANLVNSAETDASITIATSDATAKKAAIQTAIDNLGTAKTNADALNTDVGEYKTAYDEWDEAKDKSDAAVTAWEGAVDTYNTNVGTAKLQYATDIATGVNQDHGSNSLVDTYSLTDRTAGGDNPTIDNVTAAKADYAGYAAKIKKTVETADTLDVRLTYTDTTYDAGTDSYTQRSNDETKKVSGWATFKSDKATAEQTAKDAYDDAVLKVTNGSTIKINVKLADDWATNWTRDTTQDGTKLASFYLNKILGAGETTPKLVDSVELDNSVTQYMYKNLTFDLNVALDSAQITYSDDQQNVTATAVQSPAFGMKPTVTTPSSESSAVTWGAWS